MTNLQVEIDDKQNKIVGCYPGLYQSAIVWNGSNNVLFCEKGVNLRNSKLTFNGNNSLIYLHAHNGPFIALDISVFSDSVIHFGKRCEAVKTVKVIAGEKKHVFVGDDCLFSYDVTVRNADGHMIYSAEDYSRVNGSKSIFIGDHVWIGQNALILKGTRIDSGSVIGGYSVVSGKMISHNSSFAGNPVRRIKDGVFWDLSLPNEYDDELLEAAGDYSRFLERMEGNYNSRDRWIYSYDQNEYVSWDEIDRSLSHGNAMDKLEFLQKLNEKKRHNRFVNN